VVRHLWAIISIIKFDENDCYAMLCSSCQW